MSLKKGTVRVKDIENINAQDVSDIKTTLALENVDNTSDANKPISTDTQNALNLKADDSSISSVGKSGNHSDLNLDDGTNPHNTNQSDVGLSNVDNTSDLNKPVSNATQNALDDKVDKVAGQGLSDENYTLSEKNKLAGIESGAEVNTVDSVNTQTGDVVLDADDIDDATTTNKFTSQSDIDRLANTSGTNTGDQDLSGIGVNASDITDLQNDKVDKVAGQGLSDENYTSTEKNKLAGIEDGAEVNTVDSVNMQTGDVVLDADDINDSTTANKFTSQSDINRLANTSGTNTGDQDISGIQTNASDITDLQNNKVDKVAGKGLSTEDYTTNEKNKLAGIESDAEVNTVDSVNTQTGDVVLDADDINDSTTNNKFTSQSDINRLANTSGTNTGDQDLSNYVDQANAKNLSLGESYANVKINDFVNNGFDVYPTDAGYQYAKLLQQDKLNDTKVLLLPQATKAGELGANKGSNFTASRATTATRVNENGLIESVAVNVPRIDYTNGNYPSILVEMQRTNLLTYSEEFDDVSWVKANTTITANATTAPGGNLTADELVENALSNFHFAQKIIAIPTASAVYTISCFLKANTRIYGALAMANDLASSAIFNLSNGTVVGTAGANVTADIVDYGNGWYRCILNKTVTSATGITAIRIGLSDSASVSSPGLTPSYTGDGVSGIYIFGAQLEEGTEPSSYIPTTSSAVTRNADVISKTGISSLIGQTEGTLFVEEEYDASVFNNGGVDDTLVALTDGTSSNIISIFHYGNTGSSYGRIARFFIRLAGVTQTLINSTALSSGTYKMAFAYKNNDVVAYINGVQIGTDAIATIPATSVVALVDPITTNAATKTVNTKQALLFKTRLTNDELATLTTL